MSVFMNRLRNRVSQATYRPRRSSGKSGDSAKSKPKTFSERLESMFIEDIDKGDDKDEAEGKAEGTSKD